MEEEVELAPRPTRARPSIAAKAKPKKAAVRERLREPAHQPKAKAVARSPAHEKPVRTRRRKLLQQDDQYYLPVEEIPDDLVYEWKRFSTMGQEDPFYVASMREQGWEPVPPSRHPNWLPPGYDQQHIIKGGLILMERPIELQREARAEEKALAKRQVREAEERLGMTPKGELTRNFPGIQNRVTKEWNRPVVVTEGDD